MTVSGLSKTFHFVKKQQKLEKTTEKVKVAVDDLSFCTTGGKFFESMIHYLEDYMYCTRKLGLYVQLVA